MAEQAKTHALASPSAAHRWLLCPGSLVMTKDLPNESSEYAEEGTRAHRLAELAIRDYVHRRPLNFAEFDELTELRRDKELWGYVNEYIDRTEELLIDTYPPEFLEVEYPLDISEITGEPGSRGTADFVAVRGRDLHIFDLKYGAGVTVLAEQGGEPNPQLAIYALAALDELDPYRLFFGIENVHLHIVQPRKQNYSDFTISAADLEAKREQYQQAAEWALRLCREPEKLDAAKDLVPGETQCRFCRAKATCPACAAVTQSVVLAAFRESDTAEQAAPLAIPVPDTTDKLAKAYGYLPLIRQWADAVEAELMKRMTNGEKPAGFKLVAGRAGIRKWSDPKAAAELLVRAVKVGGAYKKEVISPAAAEKLKKAGGIKDRTWKKLTELMTRSDPKPVIAPDDDKREEWKPALAKPEDFE